MYQLYRVNLILILAVFIANIVCIFSSSAQVSQSPKTITFPAKEWVFKEGERANGFYRIEEGQVAVIKTVNKKEKVLTTLGKGDIFGEMAIVDGKPRSASIKTLTETKLVFISSAEFKKKLDSLDPWAASLIKTLTSRLRKTTDELVEKP